jgi:predicted transposase YbfD/YdcC
MDHSQYTTLMDVLRLLPDPRKARGKRYPWLILVTLLAAGLASGQQTAHAIAQWVVLHADALRAALPDLLRLPSEATLLRTLRQIDPSVLEPAVAQLNQPQTPAEESADRVVTPAGTLLQAQAVDGKAARGATACGTPTHLVSLVGHGRGVVLAQAVVERKRSELSAVPALLHERDLTDTVITMDALLTQRALAHQIIDQGGYYLMIVKANQVRLRDNLAWFFEYPSIAADRERWDRVQTVTRAHGRMETRTLECTTGDCAWLGWPGATHIVRRTCERHVLKTGRISRTVTYGITNLPERETSAALLEQLWRGHWTIESRSHYVRDVVLNEDHNHMHTGHAPQVLATIHNALIALWRRAGWTNIADAVRATAASVGSALTFIGAQRL